MINRLKAIGPGAIVAAAFVGPGTVTTATFAGARFGYALLWAVLFSTIATFILQEMASRLGIVGRMGIGEAFKVKFQTPLLKIFSSFLIIGAILVGNAAYEAGNIAGATLGFNHFINSSFNPLPLIIGIFAFIILYFGKYKLIEKFLISLVCLMGTIFLLTAILLKPDFGQIIKSMLIPSLPANSLLMVIGLIGTTVVPYNLFLHAASVKKKWRNKEDLIISRWDTGLSIFFGGLITMAILVSATVVFQGNESVVIRIQQLAIGLKPILGDWSAHFISFGFLAAGLSSAITAPMAAGFATCEIMNWSSDLNSKKFRLIWMTVLLIGIVFSSLGFKPTMVILFAQVANGLLLPIVASFLLWIMNDKNIMGKYANSFKANLLGAIIIVVTLVIGLKGILSAAKII